MTEPRILPPSFGNGQYRRPSGATVYVTSIAPPSERSGWWTDAAGVKWITTTEALLAEAMQTAVAERDKAWTAERLPAALAEVQRRTAALETENAALRAAASRPVRRDVIRDAAGVIVAIEETPS